MDKVALLPGQKAGFANYTSYALGLNGIMVDIEGLPGEPGVADFAFRKGNNGFPATWAAGPSPARVTVRGGAGVGGSDRISLHWGGDAVRRAWLEVRVRATEATGLLAEDVFYFGNAVGESGNRAGVEALVNATDELLARQNPRSAFNPATIDHPYDYNRDRLVNATDQLIARLNTTSGFTALQLITPVGAAAPAVEPALAQTLTPRLLAVRDEGNGIRLQWTGVTEAAWVLETCEDPGGGTWEVVGAGEMEGGRMTWRIAPDHALRARFYRVTELKDGGELQ